MNLKFRPLKANEIDVRVQSVTEKGCILLLYKDARCDMNILDETVGACNQKREHQLIGDRLYCTVSIKDTDTNEWVSKQDVGTESNTEKEKGQASDSFKRACFNWGIGRELYTAPFIWVPAKDCNITEYKGKKQCKDSFEVAKIIIDENKTITALYIINSKTKKGAFTLMPPQGGNK